MIKIQKFVVNPLGENTYILSDETGECIFVDPGFFYAEERDEIKEYISSNQLKPVMIANTHCHFDHIMGVEFVREEYKVPFYAHAEDAFLVERAVGQSQMFGFDIPAVKPIDGFLTEGETVKFGNTELKILHVPGHSPGHVVFYSAKDNMLVVGDVLFYGSIGRTDLPGGNYETLISGIKSKLLTLPDETKVYSGHGPETTIGVEKWSNPFLT
ncbi:MBL fold metallo-hydrolase [Maribellus sp. YY47]|uniref:MBL fold metallo-hydrolase n=1 Tax=Maribellus sp. YY47 TaxID=2929486 RepID=UPI002000A004|nr:MBL fold metallo-hydrolase [Maribellus sp. YY47]MCK3686374.1 MBL fold metallo-hydrolase [Maribellus sp. YY47]